MAWPPPVLATNRTNATPQLDTHAADHNALALAMNDTTTKIQGLDAGVVSRGAGLIGYVERVTDAGPVTAPLITGIGNMTFPINLAHKRKLLIEFYCRQLLLGAVGDFGYIQLRVDGATVEDGLYVAVAGPGAAYSNAFSVRRWVDVNAGAHTIEAWVNSAQGSVTINANASSPMFLACTDWGDR